MAIRAVLFDWHGTLVRDDSLSFGAPAVTVSRFLGELTGVSIAPEQVERAFQDVLPPYRPGETVTSPVIDDLLPRALARLECSLADSDRADCLEVFFDSFTTGETLFDDARALLASLRYRGYRTGIVTNSIFPAPFFRRKVRELGIAGYVDTIVSSADDGFAKPHPAPFLRAVLALSVRADQALFVGDSPATDIAGAEAAGLHSVLLCRDGKQPANAHQVVSRLSALNAMLGEGPAE